MDFTEQYQKLNPEQKVAVDTIEGPVIVIAGAGTGKTQILALRIANILEKTQVDPQNILCLTFTESGVIAMRKRLLQIIGPTAYHVKICTFHSFCNEIIKNYPEKFQFRRDFEQIDDLEKIKLFQSIIDTLGLESPLRPVNDPYFYQAEIENKIKTLKQENITPDDLHDFLNQIQAFLKIIIPDLKPFLDSKGRPEESNLEAAAQQINQITNIPEKTQIYLNFCRELYTQYQGSLTGDKRNDGTQRTKYRNTLRKFLTDLEKNLAKQQELAKIYTQYQEKLAQNSRYDYEDMIVKVTHQFSQDPDFLRDHQEQFQYILVDEYQDTNSAQNLTVKMLGEFFENPNIFAVGDDDQSIYRFQGASIENIINFYRDYKENISTITLTRNYRSQQTILDAASELIKHNQNRIASHLKNIDKTLQSQTDASKTALDLNIFHSEDSENYWLANKIKDLISQGVSPSEIAILYRNHYHATELISLFKKLEIPHIVRAGKNILQDLKILQLLQLFKTIENPNNSEQLTQTLFLDFLNINKDDILKIAHHYSFHRLEKQGYTMLQLMRLPDKLSEARVNEPEKLQALANLITELKEKSLNSTLTEFFEHTLKKSGYIEHLLAQDDKLQNLNRLNTLFKNIKESTRKNHNLTITDYLENLRLHAENNIPLIEDELDSEPEAVQLMTAHKSKGLEFEHVFIIKTTQRNWCNTRSKDKIQLPKALVKAQIEDEKLEIEEDERRLFYVALTRAKHEAHLTYSRFNTSGKEEMPVIFLTEIPSELTTITEHQNEESAQIEQLETLLFTEQKEDYQFQEQAFIKGLAENHVLSPTSLNNYLTCPRKFFYQNLIRVPQAKNVHSAMGTAVHAALDQYFRKYRKTQIRPPKDLLLLSYQSALQKELLTDKDYEERLQIGQKILADYFDEHSDHFQPDTITEYNFSSHGANLEGIPLTGKIDKIVAKGQNITVTDFKTGNPDRGLTKSKHGENYWRQIIFYKILTDLSPKFTKEFKQPVTSGTIEFVEKSKTKNTYINKEIPLSSDDIIEVKDSIRFAHQQITALNFEKIEKSDPCDNCPFHNICWQ